MVVSHALKKVNYKVPKTTSGAVLFWIEAMLLPISDPELLSTFCNATTKTRTDSKEKVTTCFT